MNIILRHKKMILLIVIFISVFLIYKYNNKNNICYTTIGDGYSKGINSYYQKDYGYSDYLRDYLDENDLLNNYTEEFTDKNASIESLYKDIIINKKAKDLNIKRTLRESELLTMSIGINDLIYKLSISDDIDEQKLDKIIKEITKEFNDLIKEIRKYYQKDIYIIAYYKPNSNNYYLLEGIEKLNKMYKNNKEVVYIESNKIIKESNKYFENPANFYPNTLGYKQISKEIERKITKKLEK